MMGTLIESRARTPRRVAGSAVSILAHTTVVALAVAATAAKQMAPIRPAAVGVYRISPPPDRTPERQTPKPTSLSPLTAVPVLPTIQLPTMTPTDIPPIDFASGVTPADFRISASATGNPCPDQCSQVNTGDSTSTVWAMSEAMMQLREPAVPPRYPDALRRAGIDGSVVVKFVVDTLGRVDPATIEVLSSTHSQFTAAVRETISRLRFYPATASGRKVRAAAVMPFQFTLK